MKELRYRHLDDQVRRALAVAAVAAAVLAVLRHKFSLILEIHQRVDVLAALQHDVAARPPSPPSGPPAATNFSRWKDTAPLPPAPACTRMVALSINMNLRLFSPPSVVLPPRRAADRRRGRILFKKIYLRFVDGRPVCPQAFQKAATERASSTAVTRNGVRSPNRSSRRPLTSEEIVLPRLMLQEYSPLSCPTSGLEASSCFSVIEKENTASIDRHKPVTAT